VKKDVKTADAIKTMDIFSFIAENIATVYIPMRSLYRFVPRNTMEKIKHQTDGWCFIQINDLQSFFVNKSSNSND
jgi:hypothetical protein